MNRLFTKLLFLLLVVALPLHAQVRNEVRVILTDAPDRDIAEILERHASQIMTALAGYQPSVALQLPAAITNGDGQFGFENLQSLLQQSEISPRGNEFYSQVLLVGLQTYEIRQLYVDAGKGDDLRTLELVLSFNAAGQLTDARFALDEHQYNQILEESISLEDDFRRRQIIAYLEQFRTAYNRKDVDYIEMQFSDQALIITGTRVSAAGQSELSVTRENESFAEKFQLTRYSKSEYIGRLRNHIFRVNSFINVDFSGINILQHPEYKDIYWVEVYQKWSSSTYSDEGYLFFMIDFSDEDQPLIHVRAWQERPFADGTLIDINMFEIIK